MIIRSVLQGDLFLGLIIQNNNEKYQYFLKAVNKNNFYILTKAAFIKLFQNEHKK